MCPLRRSRAGFLALTVAASPRVGDGPACGAIDCRSTALERGPKQREDGMANHVYRLSEIVGSSETGVDDAIRTAIAKAAQTVRNLEWFETQSVRGHVVDGQ